MNSVITFCTRAVVEGSGFIFGYVMVDCFVNPIIVDLFYR